MEAQDSAEIHYSQSWGAHTPRSSAAEGEGLSHRAGAILWTGLFLSEVKGLGFPASLFPSQTKGAKIKAGMRDRMAWKHGQHPKAFLPS